MVARGEEGAAETGDRGQEPRGDELPVMTGTADSLHGTPGTHKRCMLTLLEIKSKRC